MVSTYLSYDLVTRDIKASLKRAASDPVVARDAEYYKANIGKITSVEEFLDDDRLYSYAMKAHGLEEMTYAKGFMRKVLESDLSDNDSYANRLTDDRYRNFAASFNFSGGGTTAAQSSAQIDDIIGLYKESIQATNDGVVAESRYYNAAINGVTTVQGLLQNDRLRDYVFTAYGLPEANYSYNVMKEVLSSDPSDPASYVNVNFGADYITSANQAIADITASATAAELANKSSTASLKITAYQNGIVKANIYQNLAQVFNFSADGTLPAGTLPQTDSQKSITNDLYVTNQPRITPTAALINQAYYETAVGSVTKIQDIIDDGRMMEYIITAYELPSTLALDDFRAILKSDLNDPNSFANKNGGALNANYKALAADFDFLADGTLAAGTSAQSAEQMKNTANRYMVHYNDADDAADEKLISAYEAAMSAILSVDDLLKDSNIRTLALKAFGIDPGADTTRKLKNILTSDLNDPKSYVYTLKDQRYVDFAKAFNFDTKGYITTPLMAQSESTITDTAKNYIVLQTRFLTGTEKKEAREKADAEAEYYQEQIGTVKSSADFLSDRRLVDFMLVSKGIDPETVTDDYMKQMFASDLDDPKSFANTEQDERFAEIVASFNFDAEGKLTRDALGGIQQRGEIMETVNLYTHMAMETEQGESNAGVRLALYFERMAPTITDAYDILGDTALLEVFRTTYSLPAEISNMEIEQQAALVNKYMDLTDLKNPAKLEKMIQRFTIMYDSANSGSSSSALSILMGGSAGGISADTLMALTQLKSG